MYCSQQECRLQGVGWNVEMSLTGTWQVCESWVGPGDLQTPLPQVHPQVRRLFIRKGNNGHIFSFNNRILNSACQVLTNSSVLLPADEEGRKLIPLPLLIEHVCQGVTPNKWAHEKKLSGITGLLFIKQTCVLYHCHNFQAGLTLQSYKLYYQNPFSSVWFAAVHRITSKAGHQSCRSTISVLCNCSLPLGDLAAVLTSAKQMGTFFIPTKQVSL